MNYFKFEFLVQKFNSGYYPGFTQASAIIAFSSQYAGEKDSLEIQKKFLLDTYHSLIESLNINDQFLYPAPEHPFYTFLKLPIFLLQEAGYPVFSMPKIISIKSGDELTIAFPAIQHLHIALKKVFAFTNTTLNQLDSLEINKFHENFYNLVNQLKRSSPHGINTLRLIKAANELNVPWMRIYQNVYQFGWGKNRRWLDSTFTDRTSNISAGLARNKMNTSHVLNLAGFPVPRSYIVNNANEIAQASKILNFPLVIKPLDLDGGIGVQAGLKNQEDLLKAFEQARKFSKKIMLQEHIEGKDYRIQVFNGDAYWAIERIPCHISGDGIHTIEELIIKENKSRGKGSANEILVKIKIDDETIDLLKECNLTLNDIPTKNSMVALKRSANVANGGTPIPVIEKAHQDNLNLAIDAARIIGLDLAGIDLICKDISISWKKSKAVICEVNAQPQLAKHLPQYLLEKLVKNRGRIPVIVFYGNVPNFQSFKEIIGRVYSHPGFASSRKIEKGNGRTILESPSKKSFFLNGMALIIDPDVDCLILELDFDDKLIELPIDKIDILILGEFKQNNEHLMQMKIERLASISNKCFILNKAAKIKDTKKEIYSTDDVDSQFKLLIESLI